MEGHTTYSERFVLHMVGGTSERLVVHIVGGGGFNERLVVPTVALVSGLWPATVGQFPK